MQEILKLENIVKNYGTSTKSLRGLSLTVCKGEFLSIMGNSGSGKTTLLNIIGLVEKPTSGKLFIDGSAAEELSERQRAKIRNERIGFVFQNYALIPYYTAYENISVPLLINNVNPKECRDRINYCLKLVDMEKYKNKRVSKLSGGEKQRIAIARAIANKPDIILADEPTGALDSENGQKVMELLVKLHELGNTIIMVTHNEELAKMTDRTVYIKDGVISEQ
ncbi:MAG: ABC transporter ATP-binding protein [Saccharofermentans sp.]|nr:ABC transporter ATP-binding protein [Saccharofermentans sp.]